ncbi:restriction endonuclease subunit S [Streptomyces sp. NPDC094466]|uniref:restriction endonuclease subunit S n=1 Tax=Streptomyces sp. NPDC094466 TaxID=3366065 RepID=UPI003815E811
MRDGWEGQVPLGDVLRLRSERSHSVSTLLSVTADRGVIRQSESGRRDSSSADKSLYWDVHSGDVVYNTMRMWQGVSGIANEGGIVSPAYTVCEPVGGVNSRFLGWLLKEPTLVAKFLKLSQGLVSDTWNLKYSEFKKVPVDLPSLPEQRRIAEILDEVDAQIRRADAEIAKLSKVFRGTLLGAMAALREDPDTTWLPVNEVGEVRLGRQRSPEHSEGEFIRPYLRVANVFDGFIDYSDVLSMNFNPVEQERYELQPGDILLNEGQSIELVGRSALYDGPPGMFFQNTLIRFRSAEVLPEFARLVFKYWLDTGAFADIAKKTTSIAHLGGDRFGAMLFPIPSEGAQRRAVKAVEEVGSASRHVGREVVKLKELRRALSGDLLTGKVRV